MTLADQLNAAIRRHADVADNPYLRRAAADLSAIEAAISDPVCAAFAAQLETKLQPRDLAIDPQATTIFLQTLGEAQFYLAARHRGLLLDRVQEADQRRPDFHAIVNAQDVYFEVKTLSVAGGDRAMGETLLDALNSKAEVESQIKAGRRVAVGISTVAPYGAAPHIAGLVRGTVRVLRDKIVNNLKSEQFKLGPTFLVLNLSLFTPGNAIRNLRPTFTPPRPISRNGIALASTPQSGRYWMLAFGQLGYLIQSPAEFEGKPTVEGTLDVAGILSDHAYVQGLLILNPSWHTEAFFTALFRSRDADGNDYVPLLAQQLAGDAFNDELDSNGWQLEIDDPGIEPPSS